MRLLIRGQASNGSNYLALDVRPGDTVDVLRRLIHAKTGMPPDVQSLIFCSKLLGHSATGEFFDFDDTQTLSSYGIVDESVVSLSVRAGAKRKFTPLEQRAASLEEKRRRRELDDATRDRDAARLERDDSTRDRDAARRERDDARAACVSLVHERDAARAVGDAAVADLAVERRRPQCTAIDGPSVQGLADDELDALQADVLAAQGVVSRELHRRREASTFCIACLDAPRTHMPRACRHRVLCAACAPMAHCPMCMAPVAAGDWLQVFG
mmetsp:Transcript_3928/g.11593  ORF Transcript_3928/g.11593 Transcript_3928/m.11593 type:complete len:269 (-) Transcript_3928:57-863(-)